MIDILIVEDDAKLGPTIMKGLVEQGFASALADTGKKALESLKNSPSRLVVLDLGLPDCDGIDLLNTIRAQHGSIPALILTARDGITDNTNIP